MRKLVAGAVTAAALIAAVPAGADPGNGDPNNKGCGELFSALAAPGFGQAASDLAKEGGFDGTVRSLCRQELP